MNLELLLFRMWLFCVALTRLFAMYSGFFWLSLFRERMYPTVSSQVTPLFGRLFSSWTAISFVIIVALLITPRNQAVYILNLLVFLLTIVYYVEECFVYKSASILGSALIFFVSGFTALWMIARILTGAAAFHQLQEVSVEKNDKNYYTANKATFSANEFKKSL